MDKKKYIKRNLINGYYTREIIESNDGDIADNIFVSGDVHFFRFRNDNELNIKAFIKNEFWASLPSTFNDPYDGYLTFNIKKFIKETDRDSKSLKDKDALYEINKFSTYFTKKMSYIVSLSENIKNTTMWSHYANNAKGFAIEYSLNNLNEAMDIYIDEAIDILKNHFELTDNEVDEVTWEKFKNFHKRILPVRYSVKALDYTEEMIKEHYKESNIDRTQIIKNLNSYNDENFYSTNLGIKDFLAINKNSNWSYEKEWRLIVGNVIDGPDHIALAIVPPVAIYLGEFISDNNKYLLVSAAHQKDIPIYQMKTVYTKSTNKLRPVKLDKNEISNIIEFEHFFDFKLL